MKEIIILETSRGQGGDTNLRFAFWFPIPAARQVPQPTAASAFRAADAGELAALQNGSVLEESYALQYPAATTIATIKADLISRYTARQNEIAARPNPNQFYGAFWDGATWTGA